MLRLLPVLLAVLSACKGLTAYNPGGETDTTGGGGSSVAAPTLDPVDAYTNDGNLEITGTAPAGDHVTLTVTQNGASTDVDAIVTDHAFSRHVPIDPGPAEIVAVAVEGGVESDPSNTVTTELCDPPDVYEVTADYAEGYGDTCDVSVATKAALDDDNSDSFVASGNVTTPDDVDWYRITANDLGGDEQRGWENFKVEAKLTKGSNKFALRVLRGTCDDSTAEECPGDEYDDYEWFFDDVEPDENGDVPKDSRACGDPPLNPCVDNSGDWYVEVYRKDGGFDCSSYELTVTNGAW